jgi:hypothetical protein
MIDELTEAVRNGLSAGVALGELIAILREYKERGLSQAEAQQALEALRASVAPVDENAEDRVLEMLDFVVGWCLPTARVWNNGG